MPFKLKKRKGGFKVTTPGHPQGFSKKPLSKKKALKQLYAIKVNTGEALIRDIERVLHESEIENVRKPDDLKEIMKEVSLGKDSKGFFVYTHRFRSASYKTPHDIPKSKIKFTASTG